MNHHGNREGPAPLDLSLVRLDHIKSLPPAAAPVMKVKLVWDSWRTCRNGLEPERARFSDLLGAAFGFLVYLSGSALPPLLVISLICGTDSLELGTRGI